MPANNFKFSELGQGRFAISGAFGFATAADILEQSRKLFEPYDVLEVDLAGVTQADSAGLALLLEWVNWAKHYVREISFLNMPEQVKAIARICEVEDLLKAGERWTGLVGINER